jgi:hypothetical protein
MKSRLHLAMLLMVCVFLPSLTAVAQQNATAASAMAPSNVVPSLINYSGVLKDATGRTLTSVTGVTFLLYSSEQNGTPLWLETQNVAPDRTGHYTVQLGSTSAKGLPSDLFVAGEARWLAVQIGSEAEQRRAVLVAVPYAMKAVDAQTLGGLPASAFVLAAPPSTGAAAAAGSSAAGPSSVSPSSAPPPPASNVTTAGGTASTISMFTTATNIQNSILTQIGTTAINVGGKLNLPALAAATAGAGFNSRPLDFVASVFNSTTSTAVPQTFQWQAEPLNNNKATATGSLNLLFGQGTAVPAETGLKINNKGLFTFAAGQTFPDTGTVTSVIAGAGLAGGTITKTGTISIAAGGVSNADLAHSSLTVKAGADLTGGGVVPLGGTTTLNLDTTKVPLLAAANTFTANQKVNGTLTATAFSGDGTSVTNVNATALGGIAASGYPTLAATNFFGPGFDDFDGSFGGWEVRVQNSGGGNGIIANNLAGSGTSAGIYAASPNSTQGIGVFGQSGSESGSAGTVTSLHGTVGVGVWADGGTSSGNFGLVGTVDDGPAAWFFNNSSVWDTVFIQALNGSAIPFVAGNRANGTSCSIDPSGNLNCTGAKNAIVPIDGGARTVAMSAIEAPQNWFEDAGSAELVDGVARVTLDRDFIQTVNTEMDYKVFPVPNGDCKGLYVTNKTATSFEVRELGGGTSGVRFDYRIMALRRKYENVRFADHTRDMEHIKMMQKRGSTIPHSHLPNPNLQSRAASPKAMLTPTATKPKTR